MRNKVYNIILLILISSCNSESYDFRKLSLQSQPGFGVFENKELIIQSDSTALFNTNNITNGLSTIRKSKLNRNQFEKIKKLINKSNFFKLGDKYFQKDLYDAGSTNIKIELSDGSTKEIMIYGNTEPRELRELVYFLYSLECDLEWK